MDPIARPVFIGTAQFSERELELDTAPSPLDMLTRIARESASFSGAGPRILETVDTIGFTNIMGWSPINGPSLLAERIGAKPTTTIVCAVGGETSVGLPNAIAERVARGESLDGGVKPSPLAQDRSPNIAMVQELGFSRRAAKVGYGIVD